MSFNKKFFTTGGIVASTPPAAAGLDPLQNFETVTYTGNGSTQKITGYIRKGAAFNGSSSGIDLPSLTNSYPFTVSAWINTSDFPSNTFSPIVQQNIAGQRITIGSTSLWNPNQIAIAFGGTSQFSTDANSITSNQWTHIVACFRASTDFDFYINGSAANVTNNGGNHGGTAANALGYNGLGTEWFNGKIDQVRIFNTALNPTQVGQLALETYADPKKSTTDYFGDGSGVALYELDEDAKDTGVPIDSGQSGDFNGINSYISTIAEPIPATSNFSISFWINRTSSSNADLFNQASSSGDIRTYFALDSDGTFRVGSAGTNGSRIQVPNTTSSITNGQWEHIAIVRDGSNMTFYINGTGETETISGGVVGVGRGDMIIGSPSVSPIAKIDDIRIFNDALTSTEVGYLRNNDTTNIGTINNFIAHYKLDGDAVDSVGSGTYSGNEYNLTYSDPAAIAYNGTPTNVNFLGMAFQPDLVWIKNRDDATNHVLHDSVRGTSSILYSDLPNSADVGSGNDFQSFDTNGFTVGGSNYYNGLDDDMVAWCWKAGGSVTPNNNTNGTIPSTVSANQDAGFSIVKFTSPSSGVATIGTGLNQQAELVISKVTNTAADWPVFVDGFDTTDYLLLNTTTDKVNHSSDLWNLSNWSNNLIGCHRDMFGTSNSVIAYCFHSVDGYQKVGSYTGTGAAGNKQTIGFQPRFILLKAYDQSSTNWIILDSIRDGNTSNRNWLKANTSEVEATTAPQGLNFLSDGFDFEGFYHNDLNWNFIYLAIA